MALDHYVSQVHLRQFLSPALDSRQLWGTRKRDLLRFPCSTKDVCRIADGNTTEFLVEPRLIEDFLRLVEPEYPRALEELRNRHLSRQTVFVVAGFASAITCCAPAATRLNIDRTRVVLNNTAKVMDFGGALPRAPASLGNKTLSELISDGAAEFAIDGKFPQAVATAGVLPKTSTLGNAFWDIFINNDHSPFFTSDFPVAVQRRGRVFSRVVPLAPDVAIRITCDPRQRGVVDTDFSSNRSRFLNASKEDVAELNEVIVRSAEESVFFKDDEAWIARYLSKHARYRLENVDVSYDTAGGVMTVNEVHAVERDD